jgi:hypothetical protein
MQRLRALGVIHRALAKHGPELEKQALVASARFSETSRICEDAADPATQNFRSGPVCSVLEFLALTLCV